MKIVIILLFLITYSSDVDGNLCSRPVVHRKLAFIYRTVSLINVQILECWYKNTPFYDISEDCSLTSPNKVLISHKVIASGSGNGYFTYHDVKTTSKQALSQKLYVAKADILKNEIYLRSGTICRYDRGFCYDPEETFNYAAVWNVTSLPKGKLLDHMELIFLDFVDIWDFTAKNLTYIFYFDKSVDNSFTLRLTNSTKLNEKDIWYTDERGYIVSFNAAQGSNYRQKKPASTYFSLKSKRFVTEAILKDCDLRSNNVLDAEIEFNADYLEDPENLKLILNQYRSFLQKNNNSTAIIGKLDSTKLLGMDENIVSLEINLGKLNSTITEKGNLSKIKLEKIEELLMKLQKESSEFKLINDEELHETKKCIQSLNETASNMETALNKKINSITSISEKCSKSLSNLKYSINSSLKICYFDMNTLNVSFSQQLNLLKNNVEDIRSSGEICEKLQKDFKHFTEKNVTNIINDVLHNHYVDDIEGNIIKKLKPTIDELNRERKNILDQISNIKKDIDGNIKKEMIKNRINIKDASRTLNQTTASILIELENGRKRFDSVDKKLTDYTSKTDQYAKHLEYEITSVENNLVLLDTKMNKFNKGMHENLEALLKDYSKEKDILSAEVNNIKNMATQSIDNLNETISKVIAEKIIYVQDQFQSMNEKLVEMKKSVDDSRKTERDSILSAQNITEKNIFRILGPKITALENRATEFREHTHKFSSDVEKEIIRFKQHISQSLILENEIKANIINVNHNISNKENITNMKLQNLEQKVNALETELENTKRLLENSEQNVRQLRQNITDFNIKHSQTIQEIKNENKEKEALFNSSLKNILALLHKKDDEIIAIRADFERVLSCCNDNSKGLLEKTKEIDGFKYIVSKNISSLQENYKSLNSTVSNYYSIPDPEPSR